MNLTTLQLTAALLIFVMTLAAGYYPFRASHKQTLSIEFPIGESLACGVFLGAGLLHMLGDAAQGFEQLHVDYPMPFLICGMTFLFLLWLEHLGREVYHTPQNRPKFFAILAVVILGIHSFLAGAALGISQQFSIGLMIFLAIIAHKWAASFALSVHLNQSALTLRTRAWAFLLFALCTPLGVILGHFVISQTTQFPLLEPIIMSISAGTFLYLGTLHGLARSVMVSKCCNLKDFSYVILGFLLMAVVAIWT